MLVTLDANYIRAALTHAAKKDVRTYLETVSIRVLDSNRVGAYATDRHRAFAAGAENITPVEGMTGTEFAFMAKGVKIPAKCSIVTLLVDGDAVTINGETSAPIAPPYRKPVSRLILSVWQSYTEHAGEVYEWAPEYLVAAEKALSPFGPVSYARRGNSLHLSSDEADAAVLILSRRPHPVTQRMDLVALFGS